MNGKKYGMATDLLAFGIVLVIFLAFLHLTRGEEAGAGELPADAAVRPESAAVSSSSGVVEAAFDESEMAEKRRKELGENPREVLLTEGAEVTIPWVDHLHEMFETSDMYIQLLGVQRAKLSTGYDVHVSTFTEGPPDNPYSEIQDEEGNLVSGHSYVIVKIKLENQGERTYEAALNRFRLVTGMQEAHELRGYNADKPRDETRSDHYVLDLLPGREYDFTLVYVVWDEVLEACGDELYLLSSFIDTGNGDDWRVEPRPVIRRAE